MVGGHTQLFRAGKARAFWCSGCDSLIAIPTDEPKLNEVALRPCCREALQETIGPAKALLGRQALAGQIAQARAVVDRIAHTGIVSQNPEVRRAARDWRNAIGKNRAMEEPTHSHLIAERCRWSTGKRATAAHEVTCYYCLGLRLFNRASRLRRGQACVVCSVQIPIAETDASFCRGCGHYICERCDTQVILPPDHEPWVHRDGDDGA